MQFHCLGIYIFPVPKVCRIDRDRLREHLEIRAGNNPDAKPTGWQHIVKIFDYIDVIRYSHCPYDLLLGRKTYEIFAGYWPFAPKDNPIAVRFNAATKYVLSRGDDKFDWKTTHKLSGIDAVKKLKATDGPDLLIQGSSTLSSQLFSVDLIDRMHIVTYPVVLGKGKRLFAEGTLPGALKLVSSVVSESGAVLSIYEPTGQKPALSSRDPEKISDVEIKRRERVKREG